MEARKAGLLDVCELAWTASLAFAAESGSWPRLRAILGYPRHLFVMTLHAVDGVLWHSRRRVAITIDPGAKGIRPSHIAAVLILLITAALLQCLFWFEPSNRQEATLQLAVLLAILGLAVGFLATLLVALVRIRPARHITACRAIRKWVRDNQIPVYNLGYLAKHPAEDSGIGFTFAKAAIAAAVPPGSGMSAIAWTSRHIRAYRAAGLTPLDINDEPTSALIGVTKKLS